MNSKRKPTVDGSEIRLTSWIVYPMVYQGFKNIPTGCFVRHFLAIFLNSGPSNHVFQRPNSPLQPLRIAASPLSHDVPRGRASKLIEFSHQGKSVAISSEETSEFKQENIWTYETYDIHCSDLLQNLPSSKSKQIFCWSCETLKNHQTSDAYQRYLWIM